MPLDTARNERFGKIEKLHYISIVLFGVLSIAVVVFAAYFGGIQGKSQHWTDSANEWEMCFTQSSFVTIPLNETINVAVAKSAAVAAQARSCLTNSFNTGPGPYVCNTPGPCNTNVTNCFFNSVNCIQSNTPKPPSGISNINIPTSSLLSSLSYIGNQALIFTAMGLAFFNRGLRHTTWLPSTIVFLIWCLFAVFTYYTVNPVLPVPTQTNATLLTFLQYAASKTKYDVFNDSNNNCNQAFNRLWGYLFLILWVAAILGFNLVLAIWAQLNRGPPKKVFQPLSNSKIPRFFASLALIFYLFFCAGKASGSKIALSGILDFNDSIDTAASKGLAIWFPKIWFPFALPSLDINTILFVTAFMSAFRGHSIQSVSAFKLAFITSLIFSLTTYPSIIGAHEFYNINNFNNWDDCWNYFLEPKTTGFFGYPSEDQAKLYCQAFRFSLVGITGLFALTHVLFITSGMVFLTNSHRNSFDGSDAHDKSDLSIHSQSIQSALVNPIFGDKKGSYA